MSNIVNITDKKPQKKSNMDDSSDWEQKLTEHVGGLNKIYALVMVGGKGRVMKEVSAEKSALNRVGFEFVNPNELRLVYQNTVIQVGVDKSGDAIFKDYLTAWMKHPLSRSYVGGVMFKPNGQVPSDCFNTWSEFSIKPKKNDSKLKRLKWHIEEIICGSNKDLINYIYNWIALTVQRPEKPAGTALVLRGEKGCGKGTIGHFLMSIWGRHALHISNPKHLTGNFNGHLSDCCFLFIDEAFFSADKQHEGVLKALITEPVMTIERKGVDAIQQPNYLKAVMATNNDWAVPASKGERRYCVFDVLPEKIGGRKYFNDLFLDCGDKSVQAAFLYEMLNRDISHFNVGDIPETKGLKAQRLHSLGSMGKWLVDVLNGGGLMHDGKWEEKPTAKALFDSYIRWCDTQHIGEYGRETQTALGRYLREVGFDKDKSGTVSWTFGTNEQAIKLFEDYEKIDIDPENDK